MAKRPEGMHAVTPHLCVKNTKQTLELYKRALGAEILHVLEIPGTNIVAHASFRIGDSTVFISDEMPGGPRQAPTDGLSSVAFYIYVDDVDAAYELATDNGLESVSAPEDMFWGDRTAVLTDGLGHNWTLATFQKEVAPEDMAVAMKSMMPAGEPA